GGRPAAGLAMGPARRPGTPAGRPARRAAPAGRRRDGGGARPATAACAVRPRAGREPSGRGARRDQRRRGWAVREKWIAILAVGPAGRGVVARAGRVVAGRVVRSAGGEGTDALARRLAALAPRNGDEVIQAARRGGPGAIRLVERAGSRCGVASRLLARHGP